VGQSEFQLSCLKQALAQDTGDFPLLTQTGTQFENKDLQFAFNEVASILSYVCTGKGGLRGFLDEAQNRFQIERQPCGQIFF
jgi:hypothetical protein